MGVRRRNSQKQQQCDAKTKDASVTGTPAETAPKGVGRRSSQRQQQRAAKNIRDAAATETTPKVPRAGSQNDTAKLMPGLDDVLAAIESLYADQLKPFGRILRKRVAEYAMLASGVAQCNEENPSDVDVKHLLVVCEECCSLRVEPEEGGDWSVTIVDRPDTFVDVYGSADLYPLGMWGAAAAYFQLLSSDNMYLPGGRYSCAQELQARDLAFLEGRSLGQVCHIVQLAISQKKLLGYLNGAVVPYASSQSMLKEQCAQRNAACSASRASNETGTAVAENSLNMATWETAREFLRDILNDAKSSQDEVGTVPLSNVKRLFRSRFHTELSETKLGHSKLTQLLQDERFSDICEVELQGHGYIVKQADPQENHTISLQQPLPTHDGELLPQLGSQEPMTLDLNEAGLFVGSAPSPTVAKARWPHTHGYVHNLVQRTFIHASLPPPTPPPNAKRRSASLPKDSGSCKGSPELQCLSLGGDHADETNSTVDSAIGSEGAELSQSCTTPSRRPSIDDPIKVLLRECNLGATMEPMKLKESVPADLLDSAEDAQPRLRLQFCPDEPLALEEAGVFLDSAPVTQTPYTPNFPRSWCVMPSPLAQYGCVGTAERCDTESQRRLQFCPDEPLALDEAGIFLDADQVPQTPYTPQSVPKWPYLAPCLLAMGCPANEDAAGCVEDNASRPCFQFCPNEPLALEQADVFIDSTPLEKTPTSRRAHPSATRWPCLSPMLGSISLSKVQNTFIHSPLPPPTPLRVGASRRSLSLPKNVGSDKNTWEATCQALGYSQVPQGKENFKSPFNTGCPNTPSVYVDYVVPPSPDFPTYCNMHQLGSSPPVFVSANGPPLMNGYIWPGSSYDVPNVIRLADFLG